MLRWLLILLLNVSIVLTGVLSGPCASGAACPMAQARHSNCCDSMKPGIGAPRCCTGRQQVSRGVMATTTTRAPQGTLVAAAVPVAPPAATVSTAPPAAGPPWLTAGAAPPGGTLIAQHTSLLL